jgi:hypothetical protein
VKLQAKALFFQLFVCFIVGTLLVLPRPAAALTLVWQDQVFSSGVEVVSPVLFSGREYQIVVSDVWWYSEPLENNLAGDAMYYTTNGTDSWDWVDFLPAPGGGSFLQIDAQNVSWGAFSNGDTGHMYTINYTGAGAAIVFRIVDWVDGNYGNNVCHLLVSIYAAVPVGGYLVDDGSFESSFPWVALASVAIACAVVPFVKLREKKRV